MPSNRSHGSTFKNKRTGILKTSKIDSCSSSSMSSLDGEHQHSLCTTPNTKVVQFRLSPNDQQRNLEKNYDLMAFGSPDRPTGRSLDPAQILWRFWKWTNEETGRISPNPTIEIMTSSLRNMFHFKDRLKSSNVQIYSTFALRIFSLASNANLFDFFDEQIILQARIQRGHRSQSSPKALCSYFVFQNGVPPLWEDEFNNKGGRWQTTIYPGKAFEPDTIKHVWRELLLMLTEKMLPYLEEVCGIALTVRANKSYKISVWNRNASNTIAKLMIGFVVNVFVVLHQIIFIFIYFQSHSEGNFKSFPHFVLLLLSPDHSRQDFVSSFVCFRP